MLEYCPFNEELILCSQVGPTGKNITVKDVAIAAVMAGCVPQAMPVLITAFKALNNPLYNLNQSVTTSHPGGNLVLALTSKLRDEGRKLPKALILMSPWTDMAAEGESYVNNLYKDPMFGLRKKDQDNNLEEKINFFRSYAGTTDLHDPYLSPAYGHFENFPNMLIQVGSHEMLESDARTIYEKAKAAGVNVTFTHYEGMFHVFQLFGDLIPEAHRAWQEVESFIGSQFQTGK
jgi:hypothetical protein